MLSSNQQQQQQQQLAQVQQQFPSHANFAQHSATPQKSQAGLGPASTLDVQAASFTPSVAPANTADIVSAGLVIAPASSAQQSTTAAQTQKGASGLGQPVITMPVNTLFEMVKSQPIGIHHTDAQQFAQSHAHASASVPHMWPPTPSTPNVSSVASAVTSASGTHFSASGSGPVSQSPAGGVASTLPSVPSTVPGTHQQPKQAEQNRPAGTEKNMSELYELLSAAMSQYKCTPEDVRKLMDLAVNNLPAYQSSDAQHTASAAPSAVASISQQQQASQLSG